MLKANQFTCFDIIIIGAGIMGLSIARSLYKQNSSLKIAVIEKEDGLGVHASGRNSGVLHSGIYYESNSLKSKHCLNGARAMAAYCEEHHLPIKRTGKIILPIKPGDEEILMLLHQRAINNGAKVHLINRQELKTMEPDVSDEMGIAMVSPDTAIVEPKSILMHLHRSLVEKGVIFYFNNPCYQIDVINKRLFTKNHVFGYGHLYNAAGLYADKVALACGVDDRYEMLPFRGTYYKVHPGSSINIRTLIYPVPDMNVPFLGIHTTVSTDGTIYLGPSAVPALSREHYQGMQGLKWGEMKTILTTLSQQYIANHQGFRKYAHAEIPRLMKSKFLKSAQLLIPRLQMKDLLPSKKVGIRAQLIDKVKKQLIMDFLVVNTNNETHVLNAVSPAFTSAFSFSESLVECIE